jgi:hypothetical protein
VIDVDELPPTQYLMFSVLAARWRTGETIWNFPSRMKAAGRALVDAGLADWLDGNVEDTFRLAITDEAIEMLDAGRGGYLTPADRKLTRIGSLLEASMLEDSVPTTALEKALAGVLAQVRMEVER